MNTRPVIGVATQTQDPIPGETPVVWIMGQRYIEVLARLGAIPWLIPLLRDEDTLRATYERLDGVFLTGGVDVEPASYGAERHEWCGKTDPARDWVESRLVCWAQLDHKPLFAVCRGPQIVNVAAGGTLFQDVLRERPNTSKHDYFPVQGFARDRLTHEIQIVRGSRLRQILGAETACVNSMHHQAINDVAPSLRASAFAPDGVIEAIESANGNFLVAVQWHPEELVDTQPAMRRLFEAFLDAAVSTRQVRLST